MRVVLIAGLLLSLAVCCVEADEPSVSYIFPAGGQRGKTVDVRVGGHYLHGQAPFQLEGPGVTASPQVNEIETIWFEGPRIPMPDSQRAEDYPRDHAGQITIAQDAPLGLRLWRVTTSQGVTASLPFVIGHLPEVVEQEIDGQAIPQRVTLPVTINGRTFPREDVDLWEFEAQEGQTIACEVCAARIGSPLDSILEIIGPLGHRLVENSGHFGKDSYLQFTAPTGGLYQARLRDAEFGGLQHYVYRLTITAGPHVQAVYPLGGRRGSQVSLQLLGANLPSEPIGTTLPASPQSDVFHQVQVAGQSTNAFLLALDDLDEQLEAEPNDTPESGAATACPQVLNGRIDQPGDVDHWSLSVEEGKTYELDLQAARLGSPLDSVLSVLNAAGQTVATNDDLAGGVTDSRLSFTAKESGVHHLAVSARFASRGGPRFGYRLYVRQASDAPEFGLSTEVDAVSVLQGGQIRLKVDAQFPAGFKTPVTVQLQGLPAGVTAKEATINPNRPNTQLTLVAEEGAEVGVFPIQVVGVAVLDKKTGESIQRTASVAGPRGTPRKEELLLGVGMQAPFKIVGEYNSSYAGQGTVYRRKFRVQRNGYQGPITVRLADRQARHLQGVTGPTLTVPEGETRFTYPISLPPWLEIGRTSRTCVMGVAEVADKSGAPHKVSYSSTAQADQIIILADPGPLALQAMRKSIPADPSQVVEIPLRVQRSKAARVPVTLSLALPEHVQGVSADPVTVPADQSEGVLKLTFTADAGPFNMPLVVRATAQQAEDELIAEVKVDVAPMPQK